MNAQINEQLNELAQETADRWFREYEPEDAPGLVTLRELIRTALHRAHDKGYAHAQQNFGISLELGREQQV